MVFFIKQYSERPVLMLRLNRDNRLDCNRAYENLIDATITFAMKEESTGIYQVANRPGEIILQDPCESSSTSPEYCIGYRFRESDTSKPGIYIGEFKITYTDPETQSATQLIVPIENILYIHIIDSFVKSDYSYIN